MSSTGSIAGHLVVTGIRGAAEDLDPGLAGSVWQLTDDEVEAGLGGLRDVTSRVAALQGALLREAEGRDLKKRTSASTVERWLGDRFQVSRAEAAAQVRAAQAIGRHPLLGEALGHGAASPGQAEVIAGVLDTVAVMPGVPDEDRSAAGRFLVGQCATLTPAELARAGRALVEALTVAPSVDDPADQAALDREQARAEAAAQDGERNFLTVITGRGVRRTRWIVEPGTLGEAIAGRWLHDKADPKHPGTDGFEDTRTLAERRGDALIDLLADSVGTPSPRSTPNTRTEPDQPAEPDNPDEPAEPDELAEPVDPDGQGEQVDPLRDGQVDPLGDERLDPLEDGPGSAGGQQPLPGLRPTGSGAACGSCGRADRPSRRPVSAVLTVTSTVEGLRSGLAGAGWLDTGAGLSGAALRMLACDALVLPAVLATAAEVLDLGRAQRDFNRAQRRAAALRDRGCVAPGCDRPPSACQVHHMWWWTDGGPTDLDNAALLCEFHHRMVHRQGWAMTLAPNRYPHLVPPTTIDPHQRPRQHHRFQLPNLPDPTNSPGRQRT